MTQNAKLTNDEFIALRSVHRDPWAEGAGFQWKQQGKWLDVDDDGWARPVGTDEAYRWRGPLVKRGQAALALLLQRGLVQEETVRCCKGLCDHPGWRLWTLSPRGKGLIAVLSRRAARDKARLDALARAKAESLANAELSPLARLKKAILG